MKSLLKKLFGRRQYRSIRRFGRVEALESRFALDCTGPWLDVNLSGAVTPQDAVIVLTDLYSKGAHPYNAFDYPNGWLDVNYDQWVTPHDALIVIRDLLQNGSHEFSCASDTTLVVEEVEGLIYDEAVSNEQNIVLAQFEATAGDKSFLITRVELAALDGSALNIRSYSLWVDTDFDGSAETRIHENVEALSDESVAFDLNQGSVVLVGETQYFEVHGDVASSLRTDTLWFELSSIEAETLEDGADGNVSISHADQTYWFLEENGNLYVTDFLTEPQLLLGGTLSDPILTLDFYAELEDIDATDLQITAISGGLSIDRLELYKEGESTWFALATRGGVGSDPVPAGGITFQANMDSKQLVVPEGEFVTVHVRARMRTDQDGGMSGDTVELTVATDPSTVRARGDISTSEIQANDGDDVATGEIFVGTLWAEPNQPIFGEVHDVVMAKLASVTNVNPDPTGTSVPVGNDQRIAEFRFDAAPNLNSRNGLNDVVLQTMSFIIESSNIAFDEEGFSVFNKTNATVVADSYVIVELEPNVYWLTFFLDESSVNTSIDQGKSETFVLKADILNADVEAAKTSYLKVYADIGVGGLDWLDQDSVSETLFSGTDLEEWLIPSTAYQS